MHIKIRKSSTCTFKNNFYKQAKGTYMDSRTHVCEHALTHAYTAQSLCTHANMLRERETDGERQTG